MGPRAGKQNSEGEKHGVHARACTHTHTHIQKHIFTFSSPRLLKSGSFTQQIMIELLYFPGTVLASGSVGRHENTSVHWVGRERDRSLAEPVPPAQFLLGFMLLHGLNAERKPCCSGKENHSGLAGPKSHLCLASLSSRGEQFSHC